MCSIGILMHIVCISCMYVYWGEISHSPVEILCLYPANRELRLLGMGVGFEPSLCTYILLLISWNLELESVYGYSRCLASLRDAWL